MLEGGKIDINSGAESSFLSICISLSAFSCNSITFSGIFVSGGVCLEFVFLSCKLWASNNASIS